MFDFVTTLWALARGNSEFIAALFPECFTERRRQSG
jgi:hypothetical protein